MPHACTLCGTELSPRDKICKVCGKRVGEAEAPGANGVNTGAASSAPDDMAAGGFLIMPQAPVQNRNRRGVLRTLCGGGTGVALVGVVCWAGFTLWMRGPGGEIAFNQHNRAGNAAYERGDFSAADTEYSQMIALRPRRADGYLLRAINDYKMHQFPQAVRDNTSALALDSSPMGRGGLYYNRAEGYSNWRQWDKAVADYTASEQAYRQASVEPGAYEQDIERLPRWLADVRRGRARANLQLKNYAQTIADYTANIKAGNILPEDYGMRAAAEEGLGQDTAAAVDYGRSICLDPGYIYGYQCLDRMVEKSHRYEQAVTAYRQATEAHPDNVMGWGSLGCFQHKAGNFPAAIAAYKCALSLDPNQGWIRYNLGLSYAVSGDSDRAGKAYASALTGQDQAVQAEALDELKKALREKPGSSALQAAAKQMEAAIARNPRSPAATSSSAPPPAPRVDPAFESLLAAETTLHGYAIRPPAGYTLKQSEEVTLSGSHSVAIWQGTSRPDGTAPVLQIEIFADDGRATTQVSARQRMQQYLNRLAGNHSQLKVSAITPCAMGLKTFTKATWSGIGAKTGRQFNETVYMACQTGECVYLFAHDSAPYSAASLPLMEASAHTFRK